ncbi:hypothetical protein ACH5A3_39775 [Streptomyces echinatus]|uniref:hypothetical protein n=1 Tax=Streptomyces echinatus TaxID=67293 RepID=UPI0037984729
MKRLVGLLLALATVFGLAIAAPQPAAADGWIADGTEVFCEGMGAGMLGDALSVISGQDGGDICDVVGKAVEKKVHAAWKAVWDSVLGDVINSAADVLKWVIKKVLTTALLGPSLDLEATGLFGKDATLAGMLTWLGLLIATFGAMWQIGKTALTGQSKHLGRAMLGWVENLVLSAVGVGFIALLLTAGDALTTGLVNEAFRDDGEAYERIVSTLVPAGVSNPITMLCIVAVLLLVGFTQLVMVFLRQSAIPIQCLLLPVAAGGRAGGDAARQWAPRLITSICVVIAYKPILAVIICTGFSEFGHAGTLVEWLRGCATLVLAVFAPGPLTRLFAPFGEAVGAGLAAGGMSGALASAGSFVAGRASKDSDADEGAAPATPMERARYVEQSMGSQSGQEGRGNSGDEGGQGGDAQAQAQRNTSGGRVPEQPGEGAGGADAGASNGQAAGRAGGATTSTARRAAGAGVPIQVLDGVNNTMQNASGQIGNGGNQQ